MRISIFEGFFRVDVCCVALHSILLSFKPMEGKINIQLKFVIVSAKYSS